MLRVIGPILQKHRLTSNIAEKGLKFQKQYSPNSIVLYRFTFWHVTLSRLGFFSARGKPETDDIKIVSVRTSG